MIKTSQTITSLFSKIRDGILADGEGFADAKDESLASILRKDPAKIFTPLGTAPDTWQNQLLEFALESRPQDGSTWINKQLTLCSRQSGKSQAAAGMALVEAICNPPAEVLLVSKAKRQSQELLRKVKDLYRGLKTGTKVKRSWKPRTIKADTNSYDDRFSIYNAIEKDDASDLVKNNEHMLELSNGSRIISLPGSPDTIVGFSAIALLIIDEAARTLDALFSSLSPMRAVSEGKLVALSTPFGKRGWFYEAWDRCEKLKANGTAPDKMPWRQVKVTADQCPRISRDFLEEEKMSIGQRWYRQEYMVSFEDVVGAVFLHDDIRAALSTSGKPLFGRSESVSLRSELLTSEVKPMFKRKSIFKDGVYHGEEESH